METPALIPALYSQMHTCALRLTPGMDLKEELDTFMEQHAIQAGLVLTCVGSLTTVILRLANQDGHSRWEGHFEIVSLVGTLSTNASHLHMAVADSKGQMVGGHLLAGNLIYTTAEIIIGVLSELIFTREPDNTTGYNELTISGKK